MQALARVISDRVIRNRFPSGALGQGGKVEEDPAQPLEGLNGEGVPEAAEGRLAGQIVLARGAVGEGLEDGVGTEGVVVVLVRVAGQDAVDAGADPLQGGVLGEVGEPDGPGIDDGISKGRPSNAGAASGRGVVVLALSLAPRTVVWARDSVAPGTTAMATAEATTKGSTARAPFELQNFTHQEDHK